MMNRTTVILWWLAAIVLLCQCGVGLAKSSKQGAGCDVPPAHQYSRVVVRDSGRTAMYHCRVGYLLAGNRDVVCQDGHWSHPPPMCIGQNCPSLPYVEHAYRRLNHGRGMVGYECATGFSLKGASVLMCAGQVWNGTVPQCVDKTPKKKPKRTSNEVNKWGLSSHPTKSHENWLKQTDYTCADSDDPVRPPTISHSRVITRWTMFEDEPRLYAVYRCDWGYEASDGRNDVKMYCHERGWLGESLLCKPYVPSKSVENKAKGLQGDQAPFTHRDRLRMADYSCVSYDGTSIPVPEVSNGRGRMRYAVIDASPHLYAEYRCIDGYSLVGQNSVYCQNKTWVGKIPTCTKDDQEKDEANEPTVPPASSHTNDNQIGRHGPCSNGNGGCEQVCEIQNGLKKCACFSGYHLAKDEHSCVHHKDSGHHSDSEQIPPLVLFREG